MLTGLLANALGWRRIERQRHQDLQDRIVFAARIDREPHGGLAYAWTFRRRSYRGNTEQELDYPRPSGGTGRRHQNIRRPHLRYRDYHWADMSVTVALRLDPADGGADAGRAGQRIAGTGPAAVHRAQALPAVAPRLRRFHRGRDFAGRPAVVAAAACQMPEHPEETLTVR